MTANLVGKYYLFGNEAGEITEQISDDLVLAKIWMENGKPQDASEYHRPKLLISLSARATAFPSMVFFDGYGQWLAWCKFMTAKKEAA